MYYGGVDSGSLATKAVIINEDSKIVGSAVLYTGPNVKVSGEKALEEALKDAGVERSDLTYSISTGYGRKRLESNEQVTEISCHARGAVYFFPNTRTILDIGGQDTKAIRVNERGDVDNFAMNDKCAAGTGRFLEVMARAMEVDLEEMGPLSLQSENPQKISSFCTVFGESEVISLVANEKKPVDIISGLHESIAQRAVGMLKRVGIEDEVTLTGGVAKNIGMVKSIEDALGKKLNVCEESQILGALGAALIARERAARQKVES